jgi:hypothetical protein
MDKTIYVINGHGSILDVKKRFYIPENTYIITVNEVGVSLNEQYEHFLKFSDDIAGGPPLFLRNYESKDLSKRGEELQHFLETSEIFDDEVLILRNHLPGDSMIDILLSFDEEDEAQRKVFNITKKNPQDPVPIKEDVSHITDDIYLSDYIKSNGPGVYVLLVCRSFIHHENFLKLYEKRPEFKGEIDMYLISPEHRDKIKENLIKYDFSEFIPILDEMIEKNITPDQVIDFLTVPPQLKLARKHSYVTDDVEDIIEQRKEVEQYYHQQIQLLKSRINDIKREIKTFIDPKKKDLPHDSINLNGKIVITDQTNTKGLMTGVNQIEGKFLKSQSPRGVITSFLSVFDSMDQSFLRGKMMDLEIACDEINEYLEKIKTLPNDTLTRKRTHDEIESRTIPDSLDSLDGGKRKRKSKRKTKRKKINNFLKSARYNR